MQKVVYEDPNQPFDEDSPQKKRRQKKARDEDGEFSGPQDASGEEPESEGETGFEPVGPDELRTAEDRYKAMGETFVDMFLGRSTLISSHRTTIP